MSAEAKKTLSVLSFNVLAPCWARNPAWMGDVVVAMPAATRFAKSIQCVMQADADIVMFQEATNDFRAALCKTEALALLYDISPLSGTRTRRERTTTKRRRPVRTVR